MATLRLVASLALVTACYRSEPDLYATFPEPTEVAGPPGGEMDRSWSTAVVDGNGAGGELGYVDSSSAAPSSDSVTASCTDGEIHATLDGHGEWIYVEGYGEVWRPYTTAVGVDFTPYETCGSWVWTEWGWTFACEWDWGWLPFHYGRWGWFDDYWAWVPGYEWSPAWVEWRGGGGYVGWRPLAPIVRDHRSSTYAGGGVRDHRNQHQGPIVRDHRDRDRSGPIVRDHRDRDRSGPRVRDHRNRTASAKDWQWRFAAVNDLGKPRIRAHLYKSLAEGLRVTKAVPAPGVRPAVQPVSAASIMRSRLAVADRVAPASVRGPVRVDHRVDHRIGGRVDAAPIRGDSRGIRGERPSRPSRGSYDPSPSVYQPTWQSRRPAPSAFGAAGGSHGVGTAPSQEYTPTTPTPTPEPAEPSTQHPLKVPDRYTPTMATPPMQSSPVAPQAPIAVEPVAPQPPRHVPERVAPPQPPVYQPQRAPERYTPVQPPVVQPQRAPERYTPPPRYTPPSAPPQRAPERYTPPPSSSPPARSAPTYSPPTRAAPTYSPPARSTPSYSPPARSTPTYSPPPSRPPSGGFSGGARSHRR